MTLTDEILHQLEKEDQELLEQRHLFGIDQGEAIRIWALVQNKVMLILIDSSSSHSFVSTSFIKKTSIQTAKSKHVHVKVVNGDTPVSDQAVDM